MTTVMMQSILEQPDAIRRVLAGSTGVADFAAAFRRRALRKVWLAGSGTSLYAAMIAARAWEGELGVDCEAVSSLEFLDETEAGGLGPDAALVAISQSGASLILLEGVRRANGRGALTAVVTAEPSAPISLEASFVIETHTGPEVNLGKTKGFTTTAVAAVLLGRGVAREGASLGDRYADLPDAFARTIEASRAATGAWAKRLHGADALYVVGGGALAPTALEGALKVLEVAKMPVIPKELEEMMHGPFNGVGPDSGILLVADETARQDRLAAFLRGPALIGVPMIGIAAGPAIAGSQGPFELVLPGYEDPAMRAVLAVVPFQLLAHDLAAARGAAVDTARYPQLYPVFASKSIHK